MNEEGLRKAFQAGPECLNVEALLENLDLPVGAPQRKALEEHAAECLRCRNELALAREFAAAQPRPEEVEAVQWISARLAQNRKVEAAERAWSVATPAPWWHKIFGTFAGKAGLTAALVAAAALLIVVNVRSRETLPVIDGGTDILRSAPLRAVSPTGETSSIPELFQWTRVEGAASYTLNIEEVDHTSIFEGNFQGISAPMPDQARKLLEPGKVLVWKVSARDARGSEISVSGAQHFGIQLSKGR